MSAETKRMSYEIKQLKAALAQSIELHKSAQERADKYETERDNLADQVAALLAEKGKWTDRRAFQLSGNLGGLIRACQQIDRASGIIDRLTLIQNLADSLALADLQKGEPSFLEFLNQLCRDDRRNQSNQEK